MDLKTDTQPSVDSYWEAIWREQQEDAGKRLEYSNGFAVDALKSLFFLNGGAVISLLTFVGNSHGGLSRRGIFWALVWLVCGICSVLLSYFGAYFSQSFFMNASYARAKNALGKVLSLQVVMDEEKPASVGNAWIILSIVAAIMSFAFFSIGAFVALFAIL